MKSLFIGFLNVSLSGALLVCIVLLLRLVFKKAPKALTCALWGLAILRLLLPFQIETSFSLRPEVPTFTVRDTELTMDNHRSRITFPMRNLGTRRQSLWIIWPSVRMCGQVWQLLWVFTPSYLTLD